MGRAVPAVVSPAAAAAGGQAWVLEVSRSLRLAPGNGGLGSVDGAWVLALEEKRAEVALVLASEAQGLDRLRFDLGQGPEGFVPVFLAGSKWRGPWNLVAKRKAEEKP